MKPSTKKMEDSDSGMYSPSRQTDSRVTNRSLGTVLTRRKDSIDSGQGASITNTPFPALHSAGARTITGSGCSTMQDKMTSFVKNNFRLYVESLNLDEFEKMACISAWALEKELDDIRKQITDGKANTTTSIDLREVSLGSLRSAASHENSHDAAKASEFRDLDIDQGSLSSCSIQYNHGNSDSEVATCITDLKQESIVLTQIDPRASKFNTSVMDLKQESVVSSHSGNSDIIISDPTNSSTELNKQESLIGSQSADNSDCISMQSSQEASEEEGSNLIVFLNSVEPLDSFHALLTQPWRNYCFVYESKASSVSKDELSLKEPPKVAFHKGTEITSSQNLLLGPIQQNDELNLLEQNSTTGNFNYMLVCYKMADSCLHRSSQEINANKITISSATCKMFCLNGKMSLLVGKFNVNRTWKLSLYRLDTDTLHATWRSLSHFSLLVSESMFDFENSIPISHKNDGVVITSALNDRIVFHIFLKALSGKKSWASAFSMLSLPQGCSAKFKIQSCDVLLDHIYCSLLQPGVGARVCQFKIRILQQHQRNSINVRPSNTWHIKDDPTLQNCFISVHNEKVILICCNDANNKSIIEIKYPKSGSTTVSFAQYRFECPYIVKIVSATVVPCSESLVIALIYHDIETKKCYINRIDMSSYSCIQSPSAICI